MVLYDFRIGIKKTNFLRLKILKIFIVIFFKITKVSSYKFGKLKRLASNVPVKIRPSTLARTVKNQNFTS